MFEAICIIINTIVLLFSWLWAAMRYIYNTWEEARRLSEQRLRLEQEQREYELENQRQHQLRQEESERQTRARMERLRQVELELEQRAAERHAHEMKEAAERRQRAEDNWRREYQRIRDMTYVERYRFEYARKKERLRRLEEEQRKREEQKREQEEAERRAWEAEREAERRAWEDISARRRRRAGEDQWKKEELERQRRAHGVSRPPPVEDDRTIFRQWFARCEALLARPDTMTSFPDPPSWPCTKGCQTDPVLKACRHTIERLYRASGADLRTFLKKERQKWHPDKFSRCPRSSRGLMQAKATKMFQIIEVIRQSC